VDNLSEVVRTYVSNFGISYCYILRILAAAKTIRFNFSTHCIINRLKLFLDLNLSSSLESTESNTLCSIRDGGTSLWVFPYSNFFVTFYGITAPSGPGPPHYRGFTITFRHTTIGRTPLDK